LVGLCANGDDVVYTGREAGWFVAAVRGGAEVWRVAAPGALGIPEARGGVIYLPFVTQWLTLLDGSSGRLLTRVRADDQAVSWVRALPEGVFYGSRGVLMLDEGRRPLAAKVPSAVYGLDGFNPAAATYSALDRARLLWRAGADGWRGPVVSLGFRFLFAYDAASGKLRWARTLGADVAAAEHTGAAIVFVTANGGVGAIDPETGALAGSADVGARVLGATFAAEGYRPAGPAQPAAAIVAALAAIVRDREARFGAEKRLAAAELGRIGDGDATAALVAIVTDAATPPDPARAAAEALLARVDPKIDAPILAALAVHADHVRGTSPVAVGLLARAAGAARDRAAIDPLLAHLEDPATGAADINDIAAALTAIGGAEALPRLSSFVLLNRCDADAVGPVGSALDALADLGGAAERELLAFVAADACTAPGVAVRARTRLGGSD
jgi:hypothetical protein